MSLSGPRLETAIEDETYNQLVLLFTPSIPGDATPNQLGAIDMWWRKLAIAVATGDAQQTVDEITNNAQVNVAFVTGVQTGGNNSGPGSGTVS